MFLLKGNLGKEEKTSCVPVLTAHSFLDYAKYMEEIFNTLM